MQSLSEIYARYKDACSGSGDKGTVHSYISVYEEILAPYRLTAKRVLEVGILSGHSLRMWEEYFHTSEVHGIDVNDHPLDRWDLRPMIAEGTHHISLFDASNKQQVEQHFKGVMFDVVIEDASHELSQQLAIYENFKSHMAPGSIYIIEDVENIERDHETFKTIDPQKNVRIMDLRYVKQRFDDVLVIIS